MLPYYQHTRALRPFEQGSQTHIGATASIRPARYNKRSIMLDLTNPEIKPNAFWIHIRLDRPHHLTRWLSIVVLDTLDQWAPQLATSIRFYLTTSDKDMLASHIESYCRELMNE